MASSAAALSAHSCISNMRIRFFNNDRYMKQHKQSLNFLKIRASSSEQDDCNVEECAPDKEVGKVSMEWLAGEKTKVAGTFPPRKRDWSGYVEKDTAGQTNIYSVEPAVYVAESAISSGSSGSSADGSENTAAVFAFGGLIAVAAASVVLLQVGKNPPPIKTLDYAGPSLSYYITKFKPSGIVPQLDLQPSDTVTSTSPQETETSPQTDSNTVTVTSTDSDTVTATVTSTDSDTVTATVTSTQDPETIPQTNSNTVTVTVTSTETATPQALETEAGSG